MKMYATTERREFKMGFNNVSIDPVKGDSTLFSISVNNTFKGYLRYQDNNYHRLDDSNIHDLLFAHVCHFLKS